MVCGVQCIALNQISDSHFGQLRPFAYEAVNGEVKEITDIDQMVDSIANKHGEA